MKYLITGLGNIGSEYAQTRHNIGFDILDSWAQESNFSFTDGKYGMVAEIKFKGRTLILLKPSTYMNRSGLAVSYWLKKEKIDATNLLVLVDDLALDVATVRLRPKGGDGGHNGLASINQALGGSKYARLRFGIGKNFYPGRQVEYVLGRWTNDEEKLLSEAINKSIVMIKDFTTIGLELTMTRHNSK